MTEKQAATTPKETIDQTPRKEPTTPPRTRTQKINPRQILFINAYIKTGNATQSAIEAGYSPHSARSIAFQNLRLPYVKVYMSDYLKKITNETVINILERKQLLSELARRKGKETIQAIGELNRMEQVYQTSPTLTAAVNINYVLATKENVPQLEETIRKRQALNDGRATEDQAEAVEDETP